MHIKRLTLTLPSRLRNHADGQARLIAQAIAERLGENTPGRVHIELDDDGSSHQALAEAVGARIDAGTAISQSRPAGGGKG